MKMTCLFGIRCRVATAHAKIFAAPQAGIGLRVASSTAHDASSSILVSPVKDGFRVDSPGRSGHIVELVAALILATRE